MHVYKACALKPFTFCKLIAMRIYWYTPCQSGPGFFVYLLHRNEYALAVVCPMDHSSTPEAEKNVRYTFMSGWIALLSVMGNQSTLKEHRAEAT